MADFEIRQRIYIKWCFQLIERLADLERQLAEAKNLATWTPITPENLPKKSNEEFYLALLADSVMSMTYRAHPYDIVSGWYLCVMPHLYTHFYPLAPPQVELRELELAAKAYGKARGV